MYDPATACDIARRCAGKADDKWNRRFISMLRILGYEVEKFQSGLTLTELDLMVPRPVNEGWQYDYPALVVPRAYIRAVENEDKE
jgi:hypothetical protein